VNWEKYLARDKSTKIVRADIPQVDKGIIGGVGGKLKARVRISHWRWKI
jgi:hypothetical protein